MIPPVTRAAAVRGGLVALGAGVVGFVLARATGLGDVGSASAAANGYGATPSGSRPLAAVDDVPPDGGLVLADQGVVLLRGSGDDVHAFSATCTHQGCTVSEVTGGRILCPCHGSAFDAATGEVVTGPATAPLPTVEVTVTDGEVRAG